MVHGRIAAYQHLAQRFGAQYPPERLANAASEFAGMVKLGPQAAHHVGPVRSLWIQCSLHPRHSPSLRSTIWTTSVVVPRWMTAPGPARGSIGNVPTSVSTGIDHCFNSTS